MNEILYISLYSQRCWRHSYNIYISQTPVIGEKKLFEDFQTLGESSPEIPSVQREESPLLWSLFSCQSKTRKPFIKAECKSSIRAACPSVTHTLSPLHWKWSKWISMTNFQRPSSLVTPAVPSGIYFLSGSKACYTSYHEVLYVELPKHLKAWL